MVFQSPYFILRLLLSLICWPSPRLSLPILFPAHLPRSHFSPMFFYPCHLHFTYLFYPLDTNFILRSLFFPPFAVNLSQFNPSYPTALLLQNVTSRVLMPCFVYCSFSLLNHLQLHPRKRVEKQEGDFMVQFFCHTLLQFSLNKNFK